MDIWIIRTDEIENNVCYIPSKVSGRWATQVARFHSRTRSGIHFCNKNNLLWPITSKCQAVYCTFVFRNLSNLTAEALTWKCERIHKLQHLVDTKF